MQALWPFGRHDQSAAISAVAAAERSHQRAVADRLQAAETRAQAEVYAAQIRDHNAANRYDDFLRRVMRGDQ